MFVHTHFFIIPKFPIAIYSAIYLSIYLLCTLLCTTWIPLHSDQCPPVAKSYTYQQQVAWILLTSMTTSTTVAAHLLPPPLSPPFPHTSRLSLMAQPDPPALCCTAPLQLLAPLLHWSHLHQPLPKGDRPVPCKKAAERLHQWKAAGPDGITPRTECIIQIYKCDLN